MLSSVNPKTDAEKSDRIRIGAILRLDDDENRAGLLLKTEMLVEEERADIDFRLCAGFRMPASENLHKLGSRRIATELV